MTDDFYIGWQPKAAPAVGRPMRRVVFGLLLFAVPAALAFAAAQRTIGVSVFEWGHLKTVSGILQTTPYPHLLVARPGNADGLSRYSSYYLVAPWKFGLNPAAIAGYDGKRVTLTGTFIYRGNQVMIEVKPESIRAGETPSNVVAIPPLESLGRQTLQGEIVDSKCYLGVMNPGQLAPHRACAIRCISGGCPPVLLVRRLDGSAYYFLLVSVEGKPVNKQVLDLVAEPLEVTGDVERQGDLLILRADPATYRRL